MKSVVSVSFILLLLSVTISACLVPSSSEIEQSCSSDSDCPKGMVCKNEECTTGQDAGDNSDRDTGAGDVETKDDGDEQTDDTGNAKDTGISDANVEDEGSEAPDTANPDDGSTEDTGKDAETGEDSSTCENECMVADAQECVGSSAYKVCQSREGCLKWSETMPCGGEQKCRGEGKCGKDECEKDKKQCNSKIVQECKDEDSDLFYEWVGTQTCQNACENGLCVGCTSDSSCSTPTPRCYTTDNTCVDCLTDVDCTLANSRCETRECVCSYAECGAVCCPQGYLCYQNACCTSNCTNKCGGVSDGCGGTCTASCGSGKVCQNQACVACGGSGQPCCDGNQCNPTLTCASGNCTAQTHGNHIFSKRFGSTGSDGGNSVSVDSFGNVLVTGYFYNTVNFGGGDLASAGDKDIFLAKYDSSGNHIWSKRFGSTGSDYGYSVAVDDSDNVFVIGAFEVTVNFGGSGLISAGGSDIFLAKYDSNGNHIWSKRFGSMGSDMGNSVSTDSLGNVFITGYFYNTVNFGGGDLTSAGDKDIFLAKYDSSGNHVFSKRFGSTGSDSGNSVSASSSGNVFVTGDFQNAVNFGDSDLTSVGGSDIFIAKYDPNGNHLFSKNFGSTANDMSYAIATDNSGNIFVTGRFNNTINFGGSALTSAGIRDVFLAKFDSSGNHIFSKRFGSSNTEESYSVSTDSSGNVFITGEFYSDEINFGGDDLMSGGYPDIFLAKFDTNGNHVFSERFGSSGDDSGRSVSIDSSGNVFVTGYFSGAVNFGGDDLTSAGGYDVFLIKYSP